MLPGTLPKDSESDLVDKDPKARSSKRSTHERIDEQHEVEREKFESALTTLSEQLRVERSARERLEEELRMAKDESRQPTGSEYPAVSGLNSKENSTEATFEGGRGR